MGSQDLPVTCSQCNTPCDLESIPPGTQRTMTAAWEKVRPGFNTELTYAEFLDVKCKIENTIQLLKICGPLDHPISYVNVAGTPAIRACPTCYMPIHHISDCKHVVCAGCHTEFCWLCAKKEEDCPNWSHCARCVYPFTSVGQQIADLEHALNA